MREMLLSFARIALAMIAGVLVTAFGFEGLARLLAPEQQQNNCRLHNDDGLQFRPSCVSPPMKIFESPWMREATNECGFRTLESCRVRAPNQLRVGVIGTSIAHGHYIPYPQTWAARATVALRSACGRPVDFQNGALPITYGAFPLWHRLLDRLPAVLATRPDAIVLVMGPIDLIRYTSLADLNRKSGTLPARPKATLSLLDQAVATKKQVYSNSRLLGVLRSWTYRDSRNYASVFLRKGVEADALQVPINPAWQIRLAIIDKVFDDLGAQAAAQHVPWFVLFVPTYGQAAVASTPKVAGIDPSALGSAVARIAALHGGKFHDLTRDMRGRTRLDRYYYTVDTHPSGLGHAVIAERAVSLLRADAPAFRACTR